ncbi:MAG: MFS transporter [Rubrobacteraceae bacterium]
MSGRIRKLSLWEPLAKRPFKLLFFGQGASLLADQFFLVVLTLLALRVAGPGLELGAVLAVAAVPGAILMPLGGWASDRFPPATILVLSNTGRAALVALFGILVFLDNTQLWHLYVLAGGLGVLDALHYPASLSIVPAFVEKEELEAANALVQGSEQVSSMVGPALAAGVVAAVGLGSAFSLNAICFLGAAVIFWVVARPGRSREASRSLDAAQEMLDLTGPGSGPLASIVEGMKYAWKDTAIRAMLFGLAAINVAAVGPVVVGGALLAEERFGGSGAFGVLLSAFGGGSLLGVIGAGSLGRQRRRGIKFLGSSALLGFALAALGFAQSLLVAAVVAAAMGVAAGYLGVVLVAWMQERVEERFQGRIMSLVVLAVVALDPLSYALAGVMTEIGIEALFVSAGALMLLSVLAGTASRTVRTLD